MQFNFEQINGKWCVTIEKDGAKERNWFSGRRAKEDALEFISEAVEPQKEAE